MDISILSNQQIVELYGQVIHELKKSKIIRTKMYSAKQKCNKMQ